MSKYARVGLIAAISSLFFLGFAGAASAQESDPYIGPTPSIAPETTVLAPENIAIENVETQTAPVAEVQGEILAFTGGDVAALAMIGVVLVGGGALVLAARRRSAVPA